MTYLSLIATCVGGRRAGFEQPPAAAKPACGLGLTARDREILDAYIKHGRIKAVAHELGATHRSIDYAISRMQEKAGVVSSVQLVAAYVAAQLKGQ